VKCPVCKDRFRPTRPRQEVCGDVPCALTWSGLKVQKAQERKIKAQGARDRQWLIDNKPLGELRKEVQANAFNPWIRYRDRLENCISCDRTPEEIEKVQGHKAGGAWDCGHFQPTGSHPELRWCEVNAHRQHSRCNRGAAKSARNDRSVAAQYETNLRARIGGDIVDWLQGPHPALHMLNDELEALEKHYKKAAKEAKIYNEQNQA
jgi:hypothetical protein